MRFDRRFLSMPVPDGIPHPSTSVGLAIADFHQ
jgi:hypothetical protein